MENPTENENLLPDRDVFGFEKPAIPTDNVQTLPAKPDLHVKYAGLGIRFLAYIIDVAILIVPLYYIELTILGDDHNTPDARFLQILIDLVVWALYCAGMESSQMQATLGKRGCNLKVIDEYGDRLSFQKATYRYLAKFISILPLGFGILAIVYDKKRQGWHDTITGCFVIRDEDAPEGDE